MQFLLVSMKIKKFSGLFKTVIASERNEMESSMIACLKEKGIPNRTNISPISLLQKNALRAFFSKFRWKSHLIDQLVQQVDF